MTVKELIVALLEKAGDVDNDQVRFSFSDPSGAEVVNADEITINSSYAGTVLIENL